MTGPIFHGWDMPLYPKTKEKRKMRMTWHSPECFASYDDPDESECTCGAYDHGMETGKCYWHDVLLTEDGVCTVCQKELYE